jgi:cysteine synthase A
MRRASPRCGGWRPFSARAGEAGSLVTMICDPGERYLETYYDRGWLQDQDLDVRPYIEHLEAFAQSGELNAP